MNTRLVKYAAQTSPRVLPKPNIPHLRKGVLYEIRFCETLSQTLPTSFEIKFNQWFEYKRSYAREVSVCCPDILIFDRDQNKCIVVEVKLTYTPQAREKLDMLYCPVVRMALGLPTLGLVVVKNLLPNCPRPALRFGLALEQGLFQWNMQDRLIW